MLRSGEIRALARQSLAGLWWRSAWQYFVFLLICGLPVWLLNMVNEWAGQLASFAISGAVSFGMYAYFLSLARGQTPSFSVYFSGFERFWPALLLYLLITVFTVLWMLLLIVPGIIAAIRYSQAYYILRDHPEITPLEALNRSKSMMQGRKWRFFKLALSFIGWIVLAVLPFGLGIFWLVPYMETSFAHFHREAAGQGFPQP